LQADIFLKKDHHMKNLKWEKIKLTPGMSHTRTTVEDNFSPEDKMALPIFIRELVQNTIDSRSDKSSVLRMHIRTLQCGVGKDIEPKTLKKLFSGISEPLSLSGSDYSEDMCDSGVILVVEEEGTTGLTGQYLITNQIGGNWCRFWFNEGSPGEKGLGSLGGAGQGKITYHLNSAARTVLAVTKREDDGKELMFGKAYLKKTFQDPKKKSFDRVVNWSKINPQQEPLPEDDPSCIKEFKKLFSLTRKSNGTSLVIPFVNKDAFTTKNIMKALVSEYYSLFIYENFSATVNGNSIDADNVAEIIEAYTDGEDFKPDFYNFLYESRTNPEENVITLPDDWAPKQIAQHGIDKKHIPEKQLKNLQKRFNEGEVLSFCCPVGIAHKDSKTDKSSFTCHIQKHDTHLCDHYVRGGMRIDKENHLKSATSTGFGLVYIAKGPVFEFLKVGEDASHREWNKKKINDAQLFENSSALDIVRHSLPALFRLFVDSEEIRNDESSLMDLFSMPKIQLPDPPPPEPNDETEIPEIDPDDVDDPIDFPELEPDKYDVEFLPNKIKISATAYGKKRTFPRNIKVRLALDKPTGNIWSKYHPFDFDLSDTASCSISTRDANVGDFGKNKANFELRAKDFVIEITGLTNKLQLVCEVSEDA
jgi:hypothetical protein